MWHAAGMHSNGNSFSNGHSVNISGQPREPWIWRLMGPIQPGAV